MTEMVTDVDLVRTQLLIADGQDLGQLNLAQEPDPPRGLPCNCASTWKPWRVTAVQKLPEASSICLSYRSGPDVRVDTYGYTGYVTSPAFDSLLAKVIVRHTENNWSALLNRANRCLAEMSISIPTNKEFLASLLTHPKVVENGMLIHGLLKRISPSSWKRMVSCIQCGHSGGWQRPEAETRLECRTATNRLRSYSCTLCRVGITAIEVEVGSQLSQGQTVLIMDAMKMEHVIESPVSGTVHELRTASGKRFSKALFWPSY